MRAIQFNLRCLKEPVTHEGGRLILSCFCYSCYSLWRIVQMAPIRITESGELNSTFSKPCSLQPVFFMRPCSSRQLHLPETRRQIGAVKKWGLCRGGVFLLVKIPWTFWGHQGGIPGVFSLVSQTLSCLRVAAVGFLLEKPRCLSPSGCVHPVSGACYNNVNAL